MHPNRTNMTNWLIHFVNKKYKNQISNNLTDFQFLTYLEYIANKVFDYLN